MLKTRLLICLGIVAPATPALGAQFFIIHDSTTNRSTITEQLPDPRPAVPDPSNGFVVSHRVIGYNALSSSPHLHRRTPGPPKPI